MRLCLVVANQTLMGEELLQALLAKQEGGDVAFHVVVPATHPKGAWSEGSVPQGAFTTINSLLADGSRVVLSPIEINEPVLLSKLSGPNGRAKASDFPTPVPGCSTFTATTSNSN